MVKEDDRGGFEKVIWYEMGKEFNCKWAELYEH